MLITMITGNSHGNNTSADANVCASNNDHDDNTKFSTKIMIVNLTVMKIIITGFISVIRLQ